MLAEVPGRSPTVMRDAAGPFFQGLAGHAQQPGRDLVGRSAVHRNSRRPVARSEASGLRNYFSRMSLATELTPFTSRASATA